MPICSYRNLQKKKLENWETSVLGKAEGDFVEEATFRWASQIFHLWKWRREGAGEDTWAPAGGKARDGEPHRGELGLAGRSVRRRQWGPPHLLGPCPLCPAPGGGSLWSAWLGFLALWLLLGFSPREAQAGDRRAGREALVWELGRRFAFTGRDLGWVSAHLPSSFPVCVSGVPWVRKGIAYWPVPASNDRIVLRGHRAFLPLSRALDSSPPPFGVRWFHGRCISFSPVPAQHRTWDKSRTVGAHQFSLSGVAVRAFLAHVTWKVRGGKWLLWHFRL